MDMKTGYLFALIGLLCGALTCGVSAQPAPPVPTDKTDAKNTNQPVKPQEDSKSVNTNAVKEVAVIKTIAGEMVVVAGRGA